MNMVGVILAGGKSTRMKQDKAMLKYKGTCLLQHQFENLEWHLGKGNVLVSGNRPGFPHVCDIFAELGPIEGVRSVIHYLSSVGKKDSVLIIPVDMPFISETGLRRLIEHRTNFDGTKFCGQQLPIVIHNTENFLIAIETLKNSTNPSSKGGLSFNHLFRQVKMDEIPAEVDEFFANINTPEDWHATLS